MFKFTENSPNVAMFVRLLEAGVIDESRVPHLFNLRDVVFSIYNPKVEPEPEQETVQEEEQEPEQVPEEETEPVEETQEEPVQDSEEQVTEPEDSGEVEPPDEVAAGTES